jgi:surface protein
MRIGRTSFTLMMLLMHDGITNISKMFNNCSSLTELDLSSFNTINVTNMGNMFQDCSSLTSLNIQNFNSKNITFMNNIFSGVNKKCKIICNDQKILSQF